MRRRLAAWGENFGLIEPDPSGGGYSAAGWAAKAARSKDALGDLMGSMSGYGNGGDDDRGLGQGGGGKGMEEVMGEELYVMPGWAVVRYREEEVDEGAPAPFDIQMSISGFCSRARPPSKVTRTQRVMLSIVRRFAALPGLTPNPEDQPMGPIPTAVGMALLEEADDEHESRHQSRHERAKSSSGTGTPAPGQGGVKGENEVGYGVYQSKRRRPPPLPPKPSALTSAPTAVTPGSATTSDPPTVQQQQHPRPLPPSRAGSMMSIRSIDSSGAAFVGHEAIASAHETLKRRIAPFWSTILPNRRVLVDVYAVPPSSSGARGKERSPKRETDPDTPDAVPDAHPQATLASFEIITDSNGHFSRVMTIPWEKICTTPSAVEMAFEMDKGRKLEWDVRVRTRLDYEVFEYENGEQEGSGGSRGRGGVGSNGGGGGGYRDRIRRAMATYGVDAMDEPPSGTSTQPIRRALPPRLDAGTKSDSAGQIGRAGLAGPSAGVREGAGDANGEAAGAQEGSAVSGRALEREGEAEVTKESAMRETRAAAGETAAVEAVQRLSLNTPGEPQVIVNTLVKLGSAEGIHVISDLDDTVKHSDILSGPREVFRNVFCRPLEEIVVPEMNDMYRRLDEKGVAGFHFVSNSPSQLFPSIRRFLTVNGFPDRHSIKLKYYGGRSIFSSLYESPAERKRASLKELFEAFPRARFVMLGDSAEQDLELYIEFARLYEGQVAMIAIRDVTSDRADVVLQGIQGIQGVQGQGIYDAQGMGSGTATPVSMPGGLENVADVAGASGLGQRVIGQEAGSVQRMAHDAITTLSGSSDIPTSRARPPPIRTASSSSSLPLLAEVTEDDLRSLSSSQQKILQRATTWQTRMEQAGNTVPKGTGLCFFKEAWEVESRIEEVLGVRAV